MLNNQSFKTIILDSDGNKLNLSIGDARSLSQQQGLDLVKINENKQSVVYKIMDYGKWKYDQKKSKKQKKQIHKSLKEVRFNMSIDMHDEDTKINRIKKFLMQGHETYVKIVMRNRENKYTSLAKQKLNNILFHLSKSGKYDEKKIKCITGRKRGYIGVCIIPISDRDHKELLNDETNEKKDDEGTDKTNNCIKVRPTEISQ